jgi:hypothetical protein
MDGDSDPDGKNGTLVDHLPHRRRAATGRKVFTLQTPPAREEPFDEGVGEVAGLSLHAGVAARADERQELERLCRCISRPAIAEQRLPLTPNGKVRYQLVVAVRPGAVG